MPQGPRDENPRLLRMAAGHLAFAVIVGLVATPLYLWYGEGERPLVARMAVALVVGIALYNASRRFGETYLSATASDFERALEPQREAPELDPTFVKLHTDIGHSAGSWRYFEAVLKPQLATIARRRGLPEIVLPAGPLRPRWGRWRGPGLQKLREIVTSLQRSP
jgi:hypothetical protein